MAVPASASLCTALCGVIFFGIAAAADPAPATHYSLDPGKSRLDFEFVQAGARNQGHFGQFAVSLDLSADKPGGGKLDVQVQTSSIDTGDKERDDTLKGADLFDTAKYPQARFTSAQLTRTANGYEAVGKLTLRGVTRDQRVAFALRNAQEQGKAVTYLTGKTTVKRLDFGIGQGDWKSTEWVGNEVLVSYSLRLVSTPH